MIGAIAGDIIGSVYEFDPVKRTDFPLFSPGSVFTDDSILTVALAEVILRGGNGGDYVSAMREYYRRYPHPAGDYGSSFKQWASSPFPKPYQSFGNGAAMRISPVGFAFSSLEEVLEAAREFTAVTHDHPEGIRGGQAVATAVFLARTGASKGDIREYVERVFGYDLSVTLNALRPRYGFDVTCQGTLPPAIRAFLESADWEGAVRNAVSLGGDADTLACITGGIAQAFYGGIPEATETRVYDILDASLGMVTREFMARYTG